MTDRHILTNERCHFTHPFAGRCKHPKGHLGDHEVSPLLTLDNIRSGAVPSDAVAVGFLLGEIDRLEKAKSAFAHDAAMYASRLPHVHEPIKQLCDGATPVRASTAEVVLPNTAESTASPVHPSQGYCGNWPCRLPNYHTGPCNSSPSQRT